MATLQVQSCFISSTSSSISSARRIHASAFRLPSLLKAKGMPLPELPQQMINMEELRLGEQRTATSYNAQPRPMTPSEHLLASKLYAVLEAVADRAEMHKIIGAQRNNWNHLFTNSINTITLTASIMAGISSIPVDAAAASPHLLAFKLSSALLFAAATGMMTIVNKIQPSQLAEEQRKAMSLWKQLETSIEAALALRAPTEQDVQEAMEKVLALDKAYPLPLLPGMLEKFPKVVEPARWWPERHRRRVAATHAKSANQADMNGWSKELEDEMKGALRALRAKDEEQFVTVGMLLLKINRTLAFAGPLLAGLAAAGSLLIGVEALGPLPTLFAVCGGVLATLANTLEHSGQVGMVFEVSRNCAGFYRQLEEEIESNLKERDVNKRENGDLFEMKTALQLGRSIPELKDLASYASPSCTDEDIKESAGKLF